MGRKQIRNIALVSGLAVALIVADVFTVSVAKVHMRSGEDLSAYAENANIRYVKTNAMRGYIYDRYGSTVAQDAKTYNIYCVLSEDRPSADNEIAYVKDKEYTASVLAKILHADYDVLLGYLNADVYQTELGNAGRKLSKEVKEEIESLKLPGVEFTDSTQRNYPMGVFASNLVGYAQANDEGEIVGKMGLELYLNSYLTGSDGFRSYQVDKKGYVLPGMRETNVSAVNGYNVYLTLDGGIQNALEQSFKMTQERYEAEAVYGAAMEINTGKVIAWGQYPSFDANVLDIQEYNNIGMELPYEPGSTLKTFTWAAAINEGVYNGRAIADGNVFCYTYDANNNPVRTSSKNSEGCIYNARRIQHGMVEMDKGLTLSLNTVAAKVETELITPQIYLDYLKRFGFFREVSTDGLPEQPGYLNFNYAADRLSLSYGQGSTVTMLQLMQAYSAVFSNGTMVKPYFVDSIRDPYDNAKVIYQGERKVVGTPITEETAKELQRILYRTVNDDDGTAKFYQIPECRLIGKTGTTEWAADGGYESGKTITSIMCAMPAENPQILVYYAFRSNYDPMAHRETEAVTSFLRKIAMSYGLAKKETLADENIAAKVENIKTVAMPNVVNHSLEYAQEKLEGLDALVYVLGEGGGVVDQFPSATSMVNSGQRVFLLTDASSITMPDLTGWTRKDVTALWAVTGYGFKVEGAGIVAFQSIAPGTVINKGTSISVRLEGG